MAQTGKVAHVMRRFAPEKWGGTEAVVLNLSRQLIRQGHENHIFCTDMFSRTGSDTMDGVPVNRYRYSFPWFGLSKEEKNRLRLKGGSPLSLSLFLGLMKARNLSLIHTHVQHRLGGMARTAARLKGIPYIVSIHGGYFTLPDEQVEKMTAPFAGKLEWGKIFGFLFGSRRVLQDADAVICVGRNEYDEVRTRYPAKSVHYVPNGVDIDRFSHADGQAFRSAYGIKPSEKIVLCVSRIDYQKNQLGLVRAFSPFVQEHPDYRLVLIGAVTVEGYRDQLVAEIEKLDLKERVVLIEGLRPDDPLLPGAYKAADMFVLPSHHEPFGIVILEAWATGIPVAAYRVGGIPGFATDRKNILLAEPDDESDLADCMTELADNTDLRSRFMAEGSAEVAAKYSWREVACRTLEIYEETVC